jgi:hypothetical protein
MFNQLAFETQFGLRPELLGSGLHHWQQLVAVGFAVFILLIFCTYAFTLNLRSHLLIFALTHFYLLLYMFQMRIILSSLFTSHMLLRRKQKKKKKKKKKKKNPIHQVRTACARLASVARHIPLYGLKWHSVAWQPQPCKLTNDLLLEAAALQSRFQLCV